MIHIYENIDDINTNLKYPHLFKEYGGVGISGYECVHCGLNIDYVKCNFGNYYNSVIVLDKNFKSIKAPECNQIFKEDINSLLEV